MNLITHTQLQNFFYGLKAGFQKGFDLASPVLGDLTWDVPSSTESETYHWLKDIPKMREWIGPRQVNNVVARGYTLTNKDYEGTLSVERNKIADDQMGIFGNSVQMLGAAAKRWPDDLVTQMLLAGTTNLAYDGQAYFSASHPVDMDKVGGATYDNNKTSCPLTGANLLANRAVMRSYKNDAGKFMGINPTHLLCGPALEGTARQLCESELLVAAIGANAATGGATNITKGMCKVIVVPELADVATDWFLADCSKMIKPFVFQRRQDPVFSQRTDPSSDNVWNYKEFLYGVDSRGNAGYTLPFLMLRATNA